MSPSGVREYVQAVRQRYLSATKKEKGRLLDEFCAVTGYHRKAAVRRLRQRTPTAGRRRGRQRQYGPEVAVALKEVWAAADGICSKRLVPYLPELVTVLERHGELAWEAGVRRQVLRLSAATMDRLLRSLRGPPGRRPYTQSPATTAPMRRGWCRCGLLASGRGWRREPSRATWWPIAARAPRAST